jgi:hypothetical protein
VEFSPELPAEISAAYASIPARPAASNQAKPSQDPTPSEPLGRRICEFIHRSLQIHRPHSGLAYRTPAEVATTWRDLQDLHTEAT